MSASERRLDVLRAIVEDYVATHEPVGSRALVERHNLGVSPATVRNDMAVLEQEGFIAQPHTSAGRIPTDKGYRLFVDRLAEIKTLSLAERRAIERFLDEAVDLDDVITRTVRALAQLTNQVAIVQYPVLTRATVRHIELVPLEGRRVLLVLITSRGRVEQRTVEVPVEPDPQLLADLKSRLLRACVGERTLDAADLAAEVIDTFDVAFRPVAVAIVSGLATSFANERADERVAVAGTANLARLGNDFHDTIRPVLEAIEEQVVLLRLLGEASDAGAAHVVIGRETGHEGLTGTSVVTKAYGSGGESFATLGTVGPTRMDYPATIAAVSAVARYVGRILADD